MVGLETPLSLETIMKAFLVLLKWEEGSHRILGLAFTDKEAQTLANTELGDGRGWVRSEPVTDKFIWRCTMDNKIIVIEPVELGRKDGTIDIGLLAMANLRIGVIKEAITHPKGNRLMVLQVQIGNETRQIVAGIRKHYEGTPLEGKRIMVVTNLPPVELLGVRSEGMLFAASDDKGGFSLITTDREVESGSVVK